MRKSSVQPRRRVAWVGLSPQEILASHPVGKASPEKVLELLIELFNKEHTALAKTVSFKTREARATFLRRFLRDLQHKAGYPKLPDPRNLTEQHIHAVAAVWRREGLDIGTVQTYFSFLRGLALWIGKPGMVKRAATYGWPERRRETAQHDKSWSGQGIDVEAVLKDVHAIDERVGVTLELMRAFALRCKEAVMFKPHMHVVPFSATGLPRREREAAHYLRIKDGSKGGRLRFVPVSTPLRKTALSHAMTMCTTQGESVSGSTRTLKQALRRFNYVMERAGITHKALGVTSHGLRHEELNDVYEVLSGKPSPVRGGGRPDSEVERTARQAVANLAGHSRQASSGAYLGAIRFRRPVSPGEDKKSDAPATHPPTDDDTDTSS